MNASAYVDPEVFQAERREVFAHNWQIVGDLAALAEPGDFVCANLAGFPVFAVRDGQGELQAFRNVCRHQQLPVLENGAGHCDGQIRCRYHGWTYDLSGKCVLAPPQVRPDDFETTLYALDRVCLAERGALAFVSFAPEPEPIDAAFAGIDFGAGGLAGSARGVVPVFANWKSIVDEITGGSHRMLPAGSTAFFGERSLVREEAGERWLFCAPSLCLRWVGEALTVFQVVPRTFLKSEIHWYVLGGPNAAVPDVEPLRQAAEARQANIKADQTVPALPDAVAAELLGNAQSAVRMRSE